MAEKNPTRRQRLVTPSISRSHRRFLQRQFEHCREGLAFDLHCYRQLLPEPERAEHEAAIYGSLANALRCGSFILADDQTRRLVRELAETIDESNEYERVVSEAEAFSQLLGLLEEEAH